MTTDREGEPIARVTEWAKVTVLPARAGPALATTSEHTNATTAPGGSARPNADSADLQSLGRVIVGD